MKRMAILSIVLFTCCLVSAQNVGIGTPMPVEKLDVNGNIKATGLLLTSGGVQYDFLMKSNTAGAVGYKKGHGALGMHYMIAIDGYSPWDPTPNYDGAFLGEIKLTAGNIAPEGWLFCEGQTLLVTSYISLFALIGTSYGGNGTTNFTLPDLRGAVPVSVGTSSGGYTWGWGEKSN